jgi:hypothetical protein
MFPVSRTITTLLFFGGVASEKLCGEHESCTDLSEAAKGSAMIQLRATPAEEDVKVGTKCFIAPLESTHLLESQACLPKGLQEAHLQALRRHAMLLSTKKQGDDKIDASSSQDPDTASLDAAGFRAITSLCCPADVETFFNRLLAARGLEVCSKPHIQGMMHWFSCVPDMDFNYVIDVIDNGNHRSCKYWAPTGSTCPTLTPECDPPFCR